MVSSNNAQQAWQRAQAALALQLTASEYDTLIGPCRFFSYEDGELKLLVPNSVARDMLGNRLRPWLKEHLAQLLGEYVDVHLILDTAVPDAAAPATPLELLAAQAHPAEEQAGSLPAGGNRLNPAYTFDSLVIGPHNNLVCVAAKQIVNLEASHFASLFIYANTGLGKTHLLHAIGHLAQSLQARVCLCSSEQFTNDLVASLRHRKGSADAMDRFRRRYREVDLLLIDDLQFLANKAKTQEELFHTFAALYAAGKKVVLTSDAPPSQLHGLEQRLQSRFEGGLVVDIEAPDSETRLAILEAKTRLFGYDLALDLLHPIAFQTYANVRELEGILHRLNLIQKQQNGDLSLHQVEQHIESLAPEQEPVEPELMLKVISDNYGIKVEDLVGTARNRNTSRARQTAMYLLHRDLKLTLKATGRLLGGRDHKTISHGIRQMQQRLAGEPQLVRDIMEVRSRLQSTVATQEWT